MRNTWVKMAGGVGAAGALALSGAALSSAQSGTQNSTATPSAAASSAPSPSNGAPQGRDGGHRGHGTPVTGDTLTKVKDAVKAKDAAVTVERVFAGSDGTYHAMGTKAGQRVHVEVSKDLKTVTVRTGKGPGAGERGHGPRRTEVTGETLTNVKNAVKTKDSAIAVEKVFKENDGTYRALGTKSGAHVMVEVSKDLKTVTVKAGKPGGHGGPDGRGPGGADGHGRPGNAPGQGSNGQAPSGQGSSGQGSPSSSAGASGAAA